MNPLETRGRARLLLWLLLAAVLVLYGFPFVYLVVTSFKTPIEAIAVPPSVWPEVWTLENYIAALTRHGVAPALVNSVTTATISTGLSLVLAVPAAYAVTRFGTLSGRVFILVALISRMVPLIAVGAPLVSVMRTMRLTDTTLGLAIAHTTISLPLSIWLMASFFEVVPRELDEAARVDGCSRFQAFHRVILPVVSGGLAVTAIFAFLASWNEFLFSLLLTTIRAQTTPVVIANFQSQFGLDWGGMTALATLYSIPVIVLTLFLQRHIVAGLTLGAVKG
ncbi:MAG: carbohydrate ABC transporter permease [Arachnia sp.]